MIRPPPGSTRTATSCPYTTLVRSAFGIAPSGCSRSSSDCSKRAVLANDSRVSSPVSRPNPIAITPARSEEHTYDLKSLMRISYAVFCLTKTNQHFDVTHHMPDETNALLETELCSVNSYEHTN